MECDQERNFGGLSHARKVMFIKGMEFNTKGIWKVVQLMYDTKSIAVKNRDQFNGKQVPTRIKL